MHIDGTWQDVSQGWHRLDIVLADPASLVGGHAVTLRKRLAVTVPAESDQGEAFVVGTVPRMAVEGGEGRRIWLKVPTLANALDLIVERS